ncbi:hypothetical protein AWC38_SpisGene20991 [Stylophora pistillata]|uniref:Uncharacterized protein n=1 Tax=Stylophora pistillata TaxID=50429 RepID=A0A2B4RDD0_STYPI|nr:hypothetical protein AWC38_SpisGene20991 [Stylophora pistillata]
MGRSRTIKNDKELEEEFSLDCEKGRPNRWEGCHESLPHSREEHAEVHLGAGIYTSEVHARIAGLLDAAYKQLKDALLGDGKVKKVVETPPPMTIDEGGVVSMDVDFG